MSSSGLDCLFAQKKVRCRLAEASRELLNCVKILRGKEMKPVLVLGSKFDVHR